MLKKMVVLSGVVISALLMSGCATPVSVSEVMQQPEGTDYYLAHNVWTDGRRTVSSINYQVGSIVPFGTEVQIVKATDDSVFFNKNAVKFKVVSTGITYTIKYQEKYGMEPIDAFIKKLITTQTKSEMTEGISQDFVDAMIRGEVLPGMTRKEVIMAYGPPSLHRTPSQDMATWIYWIKRWPISKTSRVIFKGDKVLQVMK